MIRGRKKSQIDVDDLYYHTSDGKIIYETYLGSKIYKTAMKRPWGEDAHPSFGVWQAPDGLWMWKDIAREEVGNPIQFVQRLFNLSYNDAIAKIASDFGLSEGKVEVSRVYEYKERVVEKEYVHITAKIQKFKDRHHAFWNCVGVTEELCKKYNCFAVKELAINRKKLLISDYETVFVYLASDIDKVKVYFPQRGGADRFRTNVPFNYLWAEESVDSKSCDKLVIHKSMKDLITFSQLFPNNVATQNESVKVFNDEMVSKIDNLSLEPWVFYGSDSDGVKKCKEITQKNGWKYINTPSQYLPEVNDIYSFVKKYGLKELENFCNTKGLLCTSGKNSI